MKELREVDFKQGDIVKYDLGVLKGTGRISGISCSGVPFGRKAYIIEDMSLNMPNKIYPYTHFTCFEIHLEKA